MPYPELMVQPMREELTRLGFQELRTADAARDFLASAAGSSMIVVNSVCGCAAGRCRPGVAMLMSSEAKPDRLATVFAGNDVEATSFIRAQFPQIPPSSPCIFILKDGELFDFVPRHQIENQDAPAIATRLAESLQRMNQA